MKKLLFNYCLEKFLRYEEQLLGESDFKICMIALSLSDSHLFRRYASGCTTEKLCFCDPYYLEDLFLVVCADAVEHGDDLHKAFDFEMMHIHVGYCRHYPTIEDTDIMLYIEKLYCTAYKRDYALYSRLLGIEMTPENILHYFSGPQNIKEVCISELGLPKPNKYTAMIDRAWERLIKNPKFKGLFAISGKHDLYGKSAAYEWYMTRANILVQE